MNQGHVTKARVTAPWLSCRVGVATEDRSQHLDSGVEVVARLSDRLPTILKIKLFHSTLFLGVFSLRSTL